jgi:transcriptional regulator with XRE-family HTH domain
MLQKRHQEHEKIELTLAEDLSRRIRIYKKSKPHLSSQQIAKRFGMTSSTLNRIENLDIRTPSFEQVLKVLSGTGDTKAIVEHIEKHYPQANNAVRDEYIANEYWKALSPDLIQALKDPEISKILLFVRTRAETSLDYIQKQFGLEAIKILKRLQLQKLIEIKNGKVVSAKSQVKIPDPKESRDIFIRMIQNHYDYVGSLENVAENFLGFTTGRITAKKAMPVITDIIKEAQNKIREVLNREDMQGEDVFFWGAASDTLIPNTIKFQNSKLK